MQYLKIPSPKKSGPAASSSRIGSRDATAVRNESRVAREKSKLGSTTLRNPVKSSALPSIARSKSMLRKSPKEIKKCEKAADGGEFTLPAYSIRPKPPEPIAEKLVEKTIRRNINPNEDLKTIVALCKKPKGDMTAAEWVATIGPYTGDQGFLLSQVLREELNTFKKMCRKIYETMTQDTSDVLINQQVQLTEYYQEREKLLSDKMMRSVNEIFELAPGFDFDEFHKGREAYLELMFPLGEELNADSEEVEMLRRQEAYHRLQWLRSEGERLNQENMKLQQRLADLKREQKMLMDDYQRKEDEAEMKRAQLENQEAVAQENLVEVSNVMEQSIIDTEEKIRSEADQEKMNSSRSQTRVKKTGRTKSKIKLRKPVWEEETAVEIEAVNAPGGSNAGIDATMRKVEKRKGGGGFHFSPIKTPPPPPPRVRSPFHFSPIKTPPPPPPRQLSPFHYSPPQNVAAPRQEVLETRVEEQSTTKTVTRPGARFGNRRGQAPRDSWGGF